MNQSISSKQLMYSVAAFIIASSLLTSNLYYFAKNDSWVSVVFGYLFSLVIVGMYIALAKRYPGYTLIEINDAVFGRVIGKIISVLYIFFFFSLAFLNTRVMGDFIKGFILPNTPIMLIFAVFISVCAYAVAKGPVNMTRYGAVASVTAILVILFNSLLLINRTELKNLFPALVLPLGNYLIGTHIVVMLPFCEIIAFMMFTPYMREPDDFAKGLRRGLTIGACTLMLIVLRDITVLGEFTTIFSMPTFASIRYIDVGDILTRLEILYAIILTGLLFFKVSTAFFSTVSGLGRLLTIQSHRIFVLITGVLIVLYAGAGFTSSVEHMHWMLTTAATYSTFFIAFLPVLTLTVSLIRCIPKKDRIKTQQ